MYIPGPLPNGLQALQFVDLRGVVFLGFLYPDSFVPTIFLTRFVVFRLGQSCGSH